MTAATAATSPTLLVALARRRSRRGGRCAARPVIHLCRSAVTIRSLWARIVVNASGSLILGVLTGLVLYHGLGPHVLAVAGVGLCGGYTTWSTASWETIHLLHTGHGTEPSSTLGSIVVCVGCRRR